MLVYFRLAERRVVYYDVKDQDRSALKAAPMGCHEGLFYL